jgi:ATP phosphoribosyltransferase regulatory subunit
LMTQLGAPTPIPAVGFSVWVEALSKLSREPATGGLNRSAP